MSEAELNVWAAYRRYRGFPLDRIKYATANAGAYVGAVWGGKAKPADLVPRFHQPKRDSDGLDSLKAWFEARAKKSEG